MPKPLGIEIGASGSALFFRVSKPSRAEDKIYDAVQEAQCEGMTVDRFRRICREAWASELQDQAKADDREWSKP